MTVSYHEDARYSWSDDGYRSWSFAISMKALEIGSRRFETLFEMYWVESLGGIP